MNPIALLGIFLLFFIGLAMFCKVPVATPSVPPRWLSSWPPA